jgi:glycosyltransferase involved in cell wall biosynthesis
MTGEGRVCFFAERQVGIGSAAAAVEPYVRARPDSTWVDVTYWKKGGLIERLPFARGAASALRGYLQTGSGLRQGPFDALMFLTHNPAVLQPQHLRRTPTLLWMDVTPVQLDSLADTYGHPLDANPATRFVKHALVSHALRTAAVCVAWSEWVRRSLVTDYRVDESRTRVVPPGIDLSRWSMPRRDASAANGGVPRLLFVGGDFRRKGGDVLLEVFRARLRGRCELDIVTRESVPAEEGVRVHHGLTAGSPGLLALYRDASAFVLPTRGDCTPLVVIEAMAMGLPVVSTNLAGIPELVRDGETGHLVSPGDAASLGSALESLLADASRRVAMGLSGRALVEERHDARKTTERLFEHVAAIRRPSASPAS